MKPSPCSHLRGHFGLVHVLSSCCCSRAATPGSVRPSIHSRKAPPAVETKLKSCGNAGMVERGDGIAAAGDRDQRAFLGQRRRRLCQRHRRGVERRRFERAERAVPHQGAAVLEHVAERLDRRRADIEDHLVGLRLRARCRCASSAGWARIPSRRRRRRADGSCSPRLRRARRCSPLRRSAHARTAILPTLTPRAARKVLAMPPPMIR